MIRFFNFLLLTSYFSLSFAQGNYAFGPSIIVNDDPPGTHFHTTTQRSIACRGDTVYLVWRDDRYEVGLDWNPHIFFSKSTDTGNTWSPNLLIDQNLDTLSCFKPHMALDGSGNIYVVYCSKSDNDADRDLYFTKSTNGGTSFTPAIMVNDSAVVKWQTFCSVAVDSGGQNVYVVWEDTRNGHDVDIYLGRSTDGGITFLPSVRVNDGLDTMAQWVPVIACNNSGQNVYVAWMDFRDTLYGAGVYFCRSIDYGQTFGVNYRVNDTISTAGWPSIHYRNGVIFLAWRDGRDNYGVYFNKSVDGGVTFGQDVRVPDNSNAGGTHPSIAIDDSGKIYVVWIDGRTFSSTGFDIYFSYSNDSGATFKPNVRVNDLLGNLGAWDMEPTVGVNQNGKVFVAWSSDRNDPSHANSDIYFAAGKYVGIMEEAQKLKAESPKLVVYPNPFYRKTAIKFEIRKPKFETNFKSEITIKIYDAIGKLVKSFNHVTNYSFNQIIWDGRDDYGIMLPAGVYFCTVELSGKSVTKKIVKTK